MPAILFTPRDGVLRALFLPLLGWCSLIAWWTYNKSTGFDYSIGEISSFLALSFLATSSIC